MHRYLTTDRIESNYLAAKEAYALFGADADAAIATAASIPLSLHCWQGDDVGGFERSAEGLTGGIMATGNHPGKARNPEELRADLEMAASLIPGEKKVNLHAIYAETGGEKVERDELGPEHFAAWIAWAAERGMGLDFNPSFFSHPKSASGYTLASADPAVRKFWIRHGISSRRIASAMGLATGKAAVNNIWIPDGSKDYPADRLSPRLRLRDSLDEILAEKADPTVLVDSVESKLFGIGSEAYVAGSHEFYASYAAINKIALCLDMGHFHPTESVADKVSGLLPFVPAILLHLSRGMRWDSDHVLIYGDEVQAVFNEVRRADAWGRAHVALDYFDASINRIAAWAIGARAARKAILAALLEPSRLLMEAESSGRLGERLALMEELKNLPLPAVWDKLCLRCGVPAGPAWIDASDAYEERVLSKR
jgi:L-rhamnose isomerase